MARPKMSDHEKVKQRAMRLKLKLDECAQLLADELISDDPHTQILRANALVQRLSLARSIVADSDDKAELKKQLALLPSADELQAYAPLVEVSLRIGKIGKSREEEYLELTAEFDNLIVELNEIEKKKSSHCLPHRPSIKSLTRKHPLGLADLHEACWKTSIAIFPKLFLRAVMRLHALLLIPSARQKRWAGHPGRLTKL